jgi:hypothetical protein
MQTYSDFLIPYEYEYIVQHSPSLHAKYAHPCNLIFAQLQLPKTGCQYDKNAIVKLSNTKTLLLEKKSNTSPAH